jgi:uncharacterized radical SAM superfamily Fe-S cluster-containing enzyme
MTLKESERSTLGMTTSTCPVCHSLVPAKLVTKENDVYFRKFCVAHGESEVFIRSDVDDYIRTQRYVKPAWKPKTFAGTAAKGCPDGCGFCDQHDQHLCMPILEITNRCDLECPCCLNSSGSTGEQWEISRDEFSLVLDSVIDAEGQIDVLNLSGGEPLLHPDLLALLDDAAERKEIIRVSISTNGLEFLRNPDLLEEIRSRNVVVSLQIDGFNNGVYQTLRGCDLIDKKHTVLEALKEMDITTSLTMTAAAGVNDDQFPEMLQLLFGEKHIVSLMIQPMVFAGRAREMTGRIKRLTIPDIVRRIGEAGHPGIATKDFVPLPCSHPLCFSLAFYLMTADGDAVSLSRLTDASTMLDCLSNRVFFGLDVDEHEKLKQLVYDLWSGPSALAPDSAAVLQSLRQILRSISEASTEGGFDPRKVFEAAERSVKSIFIHAFQDVDTFDMSRIRRCCQAYPQRDGRLIPACVRNVLQPA